MNSPACPLCRTRFHGYSAVIDVRSQGPDVGDVLVCEGCAGFMRFDSSMQLVLIGQPQLAEIDADFRLLMEHARDALVDRWMASAPPTVFALVHCEVRRKKLAGEL